MDDPLHTGRFASNLSHISKSCIKLMGEDAPKIHLEGKKFQNLIEFEDTFVAIPF